MGGPGTDWDGAEGAGAGAAGSGLGADMGPSAPSDSSDPSDSSTEMPKSVARPLSPLEYPSPSARNFQPSPRRYSSPQISAVSWPVSGLTSKWASGSASPAAASYSRMRSDAARSKAAPSAEATSRMRATEGSTPERSVWIVSVRPSATRFLPSRQTWPEGCRGWL